MMGSRILSLAGTSETRLFVLLMLTTGGVGAFVSNTGTVALMLPIVVSMARAAGLQSSRFLMPLAFAGSMGGMLTLIGTPPNLVIRDALIHAGYGENVLSFFSFTPVGIVCLIVGILVLLPLSRRFLSKDTGENVKGKGKTLQQLAEEYQLDERLTTLKVTANSPVIGKRPRPSTSTTPTASPSLKFGAKAVRKPRCSSVWNNTLPLIQNLPMATPSFSPDLKTR